MEKMCTAQTAKDNGYASNITIDGEKCLTTEVFLGHFSKEHYSVMINGSRDAKQLFPFSDVIESQIILEPQIDFGSTGMTVTHEKASYTLENITIENLENLTVSIKNESNSGFTNNGKVSIDGNNISITLDENIATKKWEYTLTLKGDRVDGEGTYEKVFKITQWYRCVLLDVAVSRGEVNGWILTGNSGTTIDGSSAGTNVYLKNNSEKDSYYIVNNTHESLSWAFEYKDVLEFSYILRGYKNDSGNWTEIRNSNGNVAKTIVYYNDAVNYDKLQLFITLQSS